MGACLDGRTVPTNMSVRSFTAFTLAFLALAACTPAERRAERPQSTTTPRLETGITANNGGGQRALGNTVGLGVTAPDSRAR